MKKKKSSSKSKSKEGSKNKSFESKSSLKSSKSKSKSKDKDKKTPKKEEREKSVKSKSGKSVNESEGELKEKNEVQNMPANTLELTTNQEGFNPIRTRNGQQKMFPPFYSSTHNINGLLSPTGGDNNFERVGGHGHFTLGEGMNPSVNYMMTSTEGMADGQKCEGCLEQKGIWYCTDCKKILCPGCESIIHGIRSMRNHNKQPITKISSFKKLCLHHSQRFKFFCATCDEPICLECQQYGPHNTKYHRIISLKEAFDNKSSKITTIINEKLIPRYENLSGNIKIIDNSVEKLIAQANETEREINKYFNSMLGNLKNAKGKRLSVLDFESGFIQKNIVALEELKDYVNDVKETNIDLIEFLMKFDETKQKMEMALDKPKKLNIPADILELPSDIAKQKEKIIYYNQLKKELQSKNDEIYNLLNDTKIYCDNENAKIRNNLVLINSNNSNNILSENKKNNRYDLFKSNLTGIVKQNFFKSNDKSVDLLKDIQESIGHSGLNMYEVLSDFHSEEKKDCINIKDLPTALKNFDIDTNIDEVNALLQLLQISKVEPIDIKNLIIKVLLYKSDK